MFALYQTIGVSQTTSSLNKEHKTSFGGLEAAIYVVEGTAFFGQELVKEKSATTSNSQLLDSSFKSQTTHYKLPVNA